jgi:hypothetical protein
MGPMTSTSEIPKSCADTAARLVVEGALAIIQDNVNNHAPEGGALVTPEQRQKLGLAPGLTFYFAAGGEGVFFDLGKSEFRVWFSGDDYQRASDALHGRLLQAFPRAEQLDDVASKTDPRLHARVYRVDLGNGRLAGVSTAYIASPSGMKFEARVVAQQRA